MKNRMYSWDNKFKPKNVLRLLKQNIVLTMTVLLLASFQGMATNLPGELSSMDRVSKSFMQVEEKQKSVFSDQQTREITGRITDTRGEPLPGVTVIIKGTSQGTVTDMDGRYRLSVSVTDETLVFSFVGMKTLEEIIGNRTTIDLVMVEEMIDLEEVIAVGYGTQKRGSVTGAISAVKTEDISERPVGRLDQALTGKVAGLIIVDQGGVPGRPQGNFLLRGFGTPLIIVDGMEQPFNFMDAAEIESITVLKDASAAIYGARAGNGVVLVTTKRGRIQKPQFTASSSYTISQPTIFPKLADAPTYATLFNQAAIHAGYDPQWSPEEIEKFRDGTDPNYPNTDFWNETFKKWAPMKDFNLSSTGGNELLNYYVSIGGRNQGSMLRSDDINFDRYNFRSNVDVHLAKRFMASFDLSGRFENREEPGIIFEGFEPGLMQDVYRALPIYPARYPDETKPPFSGDRGYSPVFSSQKEWSGYQSSKFKSFRAAMKLNYDLNDFIQGLSTEFKFDYRMDDTFAKKWLTSYNTYYYNYDNNTQTYTYTPANIKFNEGKTTLSQSYGRSWYWILNYQLNYQRIYNDIHRVSGLLLYEALENRYDDIWAYREGFITNSIDYLYAGSDSNKDCNGSASEGGRHSVVGRFNYALRDKYLAEFIFRYDASPKFHEDYRWGFFPGVSLGWVLSEEDFLKNTDWINNLRLRVSRGQTGLEGSANFNYLAGYTFGGSYIFDPSEEVLIGLTPTGIANPQATWATVTISNAGIDGILWDGKLSFEANVFYNLKEDLLTSRAKSVPSTFGAQLPEENLNSIDTRGWELELGHKREIGNFHYNIFGNITWARSKWIHFDETVSSDEEYNFRNIQSGRWTNVTWGYITDGLFTSQEEIDGWADITGGANNLNILPGDIKYVDMNGDSVINWRDQRIIGKGLIPSTVFALGGNISYKGFQIHTLFSAGTGNTKLYRPMYRKTFAQDYNCYDYWKDAWTENNPNPNAPYPRLRIDINHPNEYDSDWWVVKNTYFLRFKELQLSYDVDKKWLTHLNINNLRLYIMAYNLAVLTNVKVDDPESTDWNNAEGRYYPLQRSFSIGLNVNF